MRSVEKGEFRMRLAIRGLLFVMLVGAIAAPALAADVKGYVHHQLDGPRLLYMCDEGYLDNAYYENQGYVYGNAFDVGAGGLLSFIDFVHHGWFTWSGPSQYNLRVYDDATCTEIAVLGPYTADDAYSTDVEQLQNLCVENLVVTGQIGVLLEPLSCYQPTDCYPDVYFDQTGFFDGCDRVFPISAPDCTPYMNGDFVMRIGVDECDTPTQNATWGSVKALYR
jgi:hypothetical protein